MFKKVIIQIKNELNVEALSEFSWGSLFCWIVQGIVGHAISFASSGDSVSQLGALMFYSRDRLC